MTIKTQRIAPGETEHLAARSAGHASLGAVLDEGPEAAGGARYCGGEQVWGRIDMGHETAFKSITGGDLRVRLFRRDFADVGRLSLRVGARPRAGALRRMRDAGGDRLSHRLFTAALESHEKGIVVAV